MGSNPLAPGITGSELSRWRSLPSDAMISAGVLHRVIDELAIQRRINEGPKLPRDVGALQRAVENLADENASLRAHLAAMIKAQQAPVVAE